MKKSLGTLFVMAVVFVFAATSYGNIIPINQLIDSKNPFYSTSVDLTNLSPTSSATLIISAMDDPGKDGPEQAWIYIEGEKVGEAWPVTSSPWEVDVSNYLGSSFTLGIEQKKGDFILQSTEIVANPIPGTVWLFGAGLAGLVTVRRRFMKT